MKPRRSSIKGVRPNPEASYEALNYIAFQMVERKSLGAIYSKMIGTIVIHGFSNISDKVGRSFHHIFR